MTWNNREVILDFYVSRAFLLSLNFMNRQNGWKKLSDPMFDLKRVLVYSGKRLVFIFSALPRRNFPHFSSFQLF